MGRRTGTLLPTHLNLLKPGVHEAISTKLHHRKAIQKQNYDKGSHPLSPLKPGQAVCMKLPGSNSWLLGSCVHSLPDCSYEVEVAGRPNRHNGRHLRTTAETPPSTNPK